MKHQTKPSFTLVGKSILIEGTIVHEGAGDSTVVGGFRPRAFGAGPVLSGGVELH